jgi:hypothetical protein
MITPTIGRIVWFTPASGSMVSHRDQPLAAIVAYVWNDHLINIAYWDANGAFNSATSVPLVQDDDSLPASFYCVWMPYQKGQAAK